MWVCLFCAFMCDYACGFGQVGINKSYFGDELTKIERSRYKARFTLIQSRLDNPKENQTHLVSLYLG